MKQRYIYSLLLGIPGIAISAFAAIFAGGATAGFFWIFVFGDNEWPFWTEWVIATIAGIVFITALSIIVRIGFSIGKKREFKNIPINSKHIMISVATLVLLAFFMITFQRGYIFEKPDHQICFDLCIQKGYDGSGTSLGPKVSGKSTCSCWNNETKEYDEVGIIE